MVSGCLLLCVHEWSAEITEIYKHIRDSPGVGFLDLGGYFGWWVWDRFLEIYELSSCLDNGGLSQEDCLMIFSF